ncbi:MAG: serine protease, partial [Eubacterium sp.]|nr:serine protease [Eubacterium sp.]
MSDFNNYNYNYGNNDFDPKNNSIFEGEGNSAANSPAGTPNGPARAPKNNKNKNRKKNGAFAKIAAYALVFGLVAGGTTYGVNRAAVAIGGTGTTSEASASAGSTGSDANTATGTTTAQIGTTNTVTTANTTSGDTSVSTVTANAMPSLVTITSMSVQELRNVFGGTQQYESQAAGTGIIVGENDDEILIATNNHVIEGATELSVGFVDETAASASLKGADSENDLAVIAV